MMSKFCVEKSCHIMSKIIVEKLCSILSNRGVEKCCQKFCLLKIYQAKKFVETCDEKFLTFQMNHAIINYADFVDICRTIL